MEESVRRIRTLMEKCATLMIGDEEDSAFARIKSGKASLRERMPEGFNIMTDTPFARYIAAGYDLTQFVINPRWR